ncbi:uncharacterized protein IWZ02DRAFT_467907 [Phyllosticta citriasiana]|uniref:uncharacterized protein n=1 Tax=Phyllosticta citriasiana TaxID=595635 RepID=UPI0030FD4073
MFELPEAKRVRRDELHSPASSLRSSPDPDLTDLFRAQLESRIELVDAQPQGVVQPAHGANDEGSEEEELEFRLFAGPTKSGGGDAAPTAQKIRINSPDLENAEGGFVKPNRPDSYYFAEVPSEELLRQLETAAVTGDQKWPGCALPWKARKALGISGGVSTEPAAAKKKRKGKKARIAIRTKLKARAEAKEAQEKAQAEKELAERAKRAKRNRDKKLKKRQRDKAKKAGVGDQVDEEANDDASDSGGDDASTASP